ncbi:MAG: glutamine-hydrolyzing GMP synthase [Eubacteriales bacterium]|nr:glutamine-hydrolyzing GMP synthase [Eubacteriales bacterium]MDD4323513.1 glutamine-hydrolyzing GMP synthase [Eubacteriales bacterium]MDD4541039.1 glutamine-hydrolyzing GMP synthase [Eubacteriales bacterium]
MQVDKILIIDLGGTRNAEIARELRRYLVYSEVHPHDITAAELAEIKDIRGVIINSGPNREVDGVLIEPSPAVMALNVPFLHTGYDGHPNLPVDAKERTKLLHEFIFDTCKATPNWTIDNFLEWKKAEIKEEVGDKKVLLALSGGVDSTVLAALLGQAIGDQLTMIHVNTGLMRKNESEQIRDVFGTKFPGQLIYVDASERFLKKLEGVAEPEAKRKIIGNEFIYVFEEESGRLKDIEFLAQGTIYPDIIESGTKTTKMIKSHHNVGALPEEMQFNLIEPLKTLFKDEVRSCGHALGVPPDLINRQPFPGPGLAVRCIGAITRDRLEAVRESDAILREEFARAGLSNKVWQYFTVVPDVRSTGMRNKERSYEWPCIIRAVNSIDAMTASVEPLSYELLARLTERITSEVEGINRVLYDVTPKPPGTIEWE